MVTHKGHQVYNTTLVFNQTIYFIYDTLHKVDNTYYATHVRKKKCYSICHSIFHISVEWRITLGISCACFNWINTFFYLLFKETKTSAINALVINAIVWQFKVKQKIYRKMFPECYINATRTESGKNIVT